MLSVLGRLHPAQLQATLPCPARRIVPVVPDTFPDIGVQLTDSMTSVGVTDLGITGAVIGPDIQAMALQYGRSPSGNLIANELPFVPAGANVVTIFTGGNDTLAITQAVNLLAGGLNPDAFISAQTQQFANDYATILSGIRSKAPQAKIVVLNLPNLGGLPFAANLPEKKLLQNISVRLDTNVTNQLPSSGATVIDALCDPRSYLNGNYSSDGYHPNDSGYAILASEMVLAIKRTRILRRSDPTRK